MFALQISKKSVQAVTLPKTYEHCEQTIGLLLLPCIVVMLPIMIKYIQSQNTEVKFEYL